MAPSSSRARTLYRSILRAHKQHLPTRAMRDLGNAYVKNEFQLHKTANAAQVERFFTEWDQYLQQLLTTARARQVSQATDNALDPNALEFGRHLPPDVSLSAEQQAQLEKLRKETESAAAAK